MPTKEASTNDEDAELRRLVARRKREREAVASTEFRHEEAAVVEWLVSVQTGPDHPDFRKRFEHAVSHASEDDLGKISGLIKGLVKALLDNDAVAISDAASLWGEFMGLGDQQSRLFAGYRWVAGAARAVRRGDPDAAPFLRWHFTTLDKRLGRLEDKWIEALLRRVEDRGKGGSGNISSVGAFAKMIAKAGAFDCTKEAAATKKIRGAIEKRKPPQRGRKIAKRR